MKIIRNGSLSLRLIILMGFVVSIIFSLAITYNYRITKQYIIEESRLSVKETVKKSTAKLVTVLDGVEKSTAYLASIVNSSELTPAQLETLLRNNFASNNDIYGSSISLNPNFPGNTGFAPYYYRGNGSVLYADLNKRQYHYTQQSWYQQTLIQGQANWSEPYFDEGAGNILMLTYSIPVFKTHAGQSLLYAIITADISLDLIDSTLQTITLGDTGLVFLLSTEGRIISHPTKKNILRPLSELFINPDMRQQWLLVEQNILLGNSVTESVSCIDKRGRCLLAYSPLTVTGWPVVVLFPENEMLAGLYSYTQQLAISSAAILLLTLLCIGLIIRKTLSPLEILAQAASQFGQGNLDITLPTQKNKDEVGRLVLAFNKMQRELKRYLQQLENETANRNRLEGELSAATQIQMSMLPGNGTLNEKHADYELWGHLIPAKSVGGDLFQYTLKDRQLTFVIGDVSDKGVPAALFMAKVSSLVQQFFNRTLSDDKKIFQLNNLLCENNDACMFVTLFYATVDLDSGQMSYISAGHHAPFLIRDGDIRQLEMQSSAALGLIEDSQYVINSFELQAGDKLFSYTDGLDETFNPQGKMFDLCGIRTLLEKNQHDSVQIIGEKAFSEALAFSDGQAQFDDTTVLALSFKPSELFLLKTFTVMQSQQFSLSNQLNTLESFFSQLHSAAERFAMAPSTLAECQLIGEEILANAINYGGAACDSALQWAIAKTEQGYLLQFIDQGLAFNPLVETAEPVLGLAAEDTAIGGLGVYLVKALTKEQAYQRKDSYNQLCVYIETAE